MLFSSGLFLWFFTAVYLVRWAGVLSAGLRVYFLLLASLFFYASWNVQYLVLIVFSTALDYWVGHRMHAASSRRQKKGWLIISLMSNLGLLGIFKYLGFFAQILNDLGGSVSPIAFVVPVGISFYTFQTLSYSIDIYRGRLAPSKHWADFALYVSFFPQLIAGPIVRAVDFLPQIRKPITIDTKAHVLGMYLMALGFLKKVAVADVLSTNLVDRVFDSPELFSSLDNLLACYAYSAQIYCDFSGYSDIAIGAGLLLGFKLPINFNRPYSATNLQDFWRRWHISLSTWLRDYLYISLGGSRGSHITTYRNLLITMLLGGLWHGASFNFVIWGALHGAALVVVRILQRASAEQGSVLSRLRATRWWSMFAYVATFNFVVMCFVIFRAVDLDTVSRMGTAITTGTIHITTPTWVIALLVGTFLTHWLPKHYEERLQTLFLSAPPILKAIALCMVLIICQAALSQDAVPFIYFQF